MSPVECQASSRDRQVMGAPVEDYKQETVRDNRGTNGRLETKDRYAMGHQ